MKGRRSVADLILRLYPPGFRRQAQEEWNEIVTWHRRELGSGSGPRARLRLTAMLLRDTATALPRAWWRSLGGHRGWTRDGIALDLRHACTSLRRRPSFTVAVVATLALGLGVTTAVTAVVHTVVLAPPPYPDPDDLIQIARIGEGRRMLQLAPSEVRDLRSGVEGALTVGVARFQDVALTTSDAPERVRGVQVTGSTLPMLGVNPMLGRLPSAADDVPGGPCVVALSSRVWREQLGGGPDIIGQATHLDGAACTVVAVMPDGFAYPAPYFAPGDLWLLTGPAGVDWDADTGLGFLVFGRLQPGSGAANAQAVLDRIAPERDDTFRFSAMSWAEPSREASSRRLLTLLVAAVLVLIVAWVNVVTLHLARNVDRRGETATRLALGASSGQLARLVVVETALLVTAGTAAGLVLATGALDLIVSLRSFWIPRMEEASIDGVAVGVALTLALLSGVLAAGITVMGLRRTRDTSSLRSSSRSLSTGRGGRRFGRALVTAETALSLILVAGSLLLYRSYRELITLEPGFRASDILHARVTPSSGHYPDDGSRRAFYTDVEASVRALPGVVNVSLTDVPPGVGAGPDQLFTIAGREPAPGTWPVTVWRGVSDAHFSTLGIELLRGDDLEGGDANPRAVVVNETFAARYFPDGGLLGARLHRVESSRAVSAEPDAWTIVGVVADVREEYAFRPVPPAVYAHLDDQPPRSAAILVRSVGSPLSLGPSVRDAVAAIDPDQPVYGIRDLPFMLNSEYDLNRLALAMLTLFAGTALLLSVAGIYGVVAHLVGQRLHEMGIRMALGALHRDVVRLVVGDSARFAAAGAVVGLVAVAATGNRLAALSPGWVGTEPAVLVTAASVVLFVAVVAAYVPARRAMGVDPVEVMRHE